MDGARHELLAGAGLPEDADRDVALRDPRDQGKDLPHGERLPDDAVDGLGAGRRCRLVLRDDALQAVLLGARPDDRGQGFPPFHRPAADAVDVEQLAFAEGEPVGLIAGENRV